MVCAAAVGSNWPTWLLAIDRPWCVASARIEADYRSRELTGQSLPARGHGSSAHSRSPLVHGMTRRKHAPRHSRLRLSTSIVDTMPGGARHFDNSTPELRAEQLAFWLGRTGAAFSAPACRDNAQQSPHCGDFEVKTKATDSSGRTKRAGGCLRYYSSISLRGAKSNTASRGTRTRLWEVVWN